MHAHFLCSVQEYTNAHILHLKICQYLFSRTSRLSLKRFFQWEMHQAQQFFLLEGWSQPGLRKQLMFQLKGFKKTHTHTHTQQLGFTMNGLTAGYICGMCTSLNGPIKAFMHKIQRFYPGQLNSLLNKRTKLSLLFNRI